MRKRNKRIQLIREFCKELKRKRFARVYKRYSKIRNEHQMPTVDKAQYLLDAEMKDKGLLKHKLYPNQPKAYVKSVSLLKNISIIILFLGRIPKQPH